MAKRKPVVDQDTCIGCMACVNTCPKVFRMNEDNKAEAYAPAGDTEANIDEAINACPVAAISWS